MSVYINELVRKWKKEILSRRGKRKFGGNDRNVLKRAEEGKTDWSEKNTCPENLIGYQIIKSVVQVLNKGVYKKKAVFDLNA